MPTWRACSRSCRQGKADNDVLFYWPEADEQDEAEGLMRQHGMHENEWLVKSPAGQKAMRMIELGYAIDFISDAQVQALEVHEGQLRTRGGDYRVLIVPATKRMPLETLAALDKHIHAGAFVRLDALPEDVPGHGRLAERRAKLQDLLKSERLIKAAAPPVDGLAFWHVCQEPAGREGLNFTRRARADGHDYFLVNLAAKPFADWLQLCRDADEVRLFDPLTGETGVTVLRAGSDRLPKVYLQLASGQSMIVRTYKGKTGAREGTWAYRKPAGPAIGLTGRWQVEFLSGGPKLPGPVTLEKLRSWTELDDALAGRFSGTARYRLEFDVPAGKSKDWMLDLGDVRETARVTLNGEFLGTTWSLPARLRVHGLKARGNVLEIEVTNLPANRVRDLDLRKVDWKIMKDINLASLKYRALDAAAWETQPSGLLGPVSLVPMKLVSPRELLIAP